MGEVGGWTLKVDHVEVDTNAIPFAHAKVHVSPLLVHLHEHWYHTEGGGGITWKDWSCVTFPCVPVPLCVGDCYGDGAQHQFSLCLTGQCFHPFVWCYENKLLHSIPGHKLCLQPFFNSCK